LKFFMAEHATAGSAHSPEWTTPHYVKRLARKERLHSRRVLEPAADPSIIAELKRNVGNQSYDECALPTGVGFADFELAVELFSGIRRLTARYANLEAGQAHRGRIVPTSAGVADR